MIEVLNEMIMPLGDELCYIYPRRCLKHTRGLDKMYCMMLRKERYPSLRLHMIP